MTIVVNIIGAGQVGKTLGHLLVKHQLAQVGAICNTSPASTFAAINFIGEGQLSPTIEQLTEADMIFITTPDALIATAADAFSKNKAIKKGTIVLHCSGARSSDELHVLKSKGCLVASVHPMRSFAEPILSVANYSGTYCAMEGDVEALAHIEPLFNGIGSITYTIDKHKKALYHMAGVFASNYLVTLSEQAQSCLRAAGVHHEMAMRVVTNLMQGTVANLEKTLSPRDALTGPIQRGDTSSIIQHMASLTDNEQKKLYSLLGKLTLPLTSHDEVKKISIEAALLSS